MADQVLQELTKLNISVSKYEEATISWHESYLTLLTEKGVHIFQLTHNLQCLEKKIDFTQSLISHPKSSPATCLFTEKIMNKNLRNIDQTEMIIDHSLWPHNLQLLNEMCAIIDFKWSPNGVLNNCDPTIAILTNVGAVELYTQHILNWDCTVHISMLLREQFCNQSSPQNFNEAKAMAHMLATSAMCWAPKLNEDNSCYFVTCQKYGSIIFWLLESNGHAKIITSIQVESSEMQALLWIPVTLNGFFLVGCNVLGQIIVFNCIIQDKTIELLNSSMIWPHKDKMVSKFLHYCEIDKNIVLICNKHRHLLVLIIDRESNKLGQYVNNINDHRITCICNTKDEFYLSTINGNVYNLHIAMEEKELNMSLDFVQYQGFSPTHELYGVALSQNKILFAMCAADKKINCKKDSLKMETLIMTSREKLDSLPNILLSNQSKLLTNYWDVLEVLRYRCLKTKALPAIDYEQLYETAVSDIYMLKVYYAVCVFCESLKKTFRISPKLELPENCSDIVKEEILVAQADKVLHKYSEKLKELGKLTQFETENYSGAKKFLEYYFSKNKKDLKDVLDASVLNVPGKNLPYTCQCCDDEVTGFRCPNDHLNMFCALTFTLINDDNYLICKWCNLTVRLELFAKRPLCLFCDIPLVPVEHFLDFNCEK